MKKIYVVLAVLFHQAAFAQIATEKIAEKINGNICTGYQALLKGEYSDIEKQFEKFLKQYGKVKESRGNYSIENPEINHVAYPEKKLYAYIHKADKGAFVWAGVFESEWDEKTLKSMQENNRKIVVQFAQSFHVAIQQRKIDEIQKGWEAVEKEYKRATNQKNDLSQKTVSNEREKADLETRLLNNSKQHTDLLNKTASNNKHLDSLERVIEKVKRHIVEQQDILRKLQSVE